jgi:hypothetical protein
VDGGGRKHDKTIVFRPATHSIKCLLPEELKEVRLTAVSQECIKEWLRSLRSHNAAASDPVARSEKKNLPSQHQSDLYEI